MGNTRAGERPAAGIPVHPHVHGEHTDHFTDARSVVGSSPRTWGTHLPFHVELDPIRFIPTYMGNTGYPATPSRSRAVHPHVHGEHLRPREGVVGGDGSSPRTWGTRHLRTLRRYRLRFIPTYMGNTLWPLISGERQTVHPHVHGEHSEMAVYEAGEIGSSPRTWGTRVCGAGTHTVCRFIPTYMGNTAVRGRGPRDSTVHPHVHGEHN